MILLLVVLQIILLVFVLRLMSRAGVSRLLSTALLFYALLWYLIPIMLSLAFGRSPLLEMFADNQVFVEYAIIETLSFIVTLLFLFRPKPYLSVIVRPSVNHIQTGPNALVLAVLLGGIAISFVVGRQFSRFLGASYLEQTAAVATSLGEGWLGAYGSFGFVQGLITAFAYLCLIMKWPERNWTHFFVIISALALTAYSVVVAVLGGSRIAMVVLPLLLVARAREHNWPVNKLVRLIIGLSMILIPVGDSLTVAIAELRQREFNIGTWLRILRTCFRAPRIFVISVGP